MNRKFYSFFFMCAINLFKNVPSLLGTPIIEGMPDEQHIFKYHVAIHKINKDTNAFEYSCGGSIIGERYVVTAAHCFMKKENDVISEMFDLANGKGMVVAGTNRLSENRIEREIIRVFIPRTYKFSPTRFADIAVVELKQDLGAAQNPSKLKIIRIWPLPVNGFEINKIGTLCGFGAYMFARGHGRIRIPRKVHSDINRFLNVRMLSKDQSGTSVYETTIYARSRNSETTACFGDSGAGLIFQGYLIGVLTHGPPNCDPNSIPMRFTRISLFTNFIERAMNEHGEHEDMYVLGEPTVYSAGHPPLN